MKTKIWMTNIILSLLFFSACDPATDLKNEEQPLLDEQVSLKVSLNNSVESLADAVNAIKNSADFKLLSGIEPIVQGNGAQMAPDRRVDSVKIMLSDISGVYEYSWKKVKRTPNAILRFFDRTADDDNLIVRLPLQKIKNYHLLFIFAPRDTALTNNFEASVSEYLLSRHFEKGLEYQMNADLKIDNTPVGNISTHKTRNKVNGFNFLSVYTLASGYAVLNQQNTGDTAVSVYSISKDNIVLYEENMTSYKVNSEVRPREKIYALTIGNVKIVRVPGPNNLDSAKVYVNGVLQTNSKVEIVITEPDPENLGFTNQKRDIKITFDDGTSTTIRELKGSTIDDIGSIFKSVRQAGFATEIVDRIAANIFWQKK